LLFAFSISGCSQTSSQEPVASLQSASQDRTVSGLQSSDRRLVDSNLQAALENSVSGKSLAWKNPSSGASGSAMPLKTWKNGHGEFCRSYAQTYRLASGQSVSRKGVACRMPNSVWKSV
jgi:surface antigen